MNDAEPAVALTDIGKQYQHREVLADIQLAVAYGEVVGLIGPNGCGKTTLLRIVAGLVQPTQGEVMVAGRTLSDVPGGVAPGLGVLFDPPGLLPHLSGYANLSMLASLRHAIDSTTVRQWLERVGLNPADRKRVGSYSQGMVQRLGIAQALMEAPRIILLDEPTNALDPAGVDLVASLIREQQDRGAAIVVASHYLEEVARVCTRVFKIADGRMVPADQGDLRRQPESPTP